MKATSSKRRTPCLLVPTLVKPLDLAERLTGTALAYKVVTDSHFWEPCLQCSDTTLAAGMTDGPCGDKFKDAFSCFVYSQEEEKGELAVLRRVVAPARRRSLPLP